jgi:hypothetical protein
MRHRYFLEYFFDEAIRLLDYLFTIDYIKINIMIVTQKVNKMVM